MIGPVESNSRRKVCGQIFYTRKLNFQKDTFTKKNRFLLYYWEKLQATAFPFMGRTRYKLRLEGRMYSQFAAIELCKLLGEKKNMWLMDNFKCATMWHTTLTTKFQNRGNP